MESQYGERRRWSQVINEEPAVPVSIANCHDSDTEPYICTSSLSLTLGSRFCERAIVSDDATDTGMGRTRNAPEIPNVPAAVRAVHYPWGSIWLRKSQRATHMRTNRSGYEAFS